MLELFYIIGAVFTMSVFFSMTDGKIGFFKLLSSGLCWPAVLGMLVGDIIRAHHNVSVDEEKKS